MFGCLLFDRCCLSLFVGLSCVVSGVLFVVCCSLCVVRCLVSVVCFVMFVLF